MKYWEKTWRKRRRGKTRYKKMVTREVEEVEKKKKEEEKESERSKREKGQEREGEERKTRGKGVPSPE